MTEEQEMTLEGYKDLSAWNQRDAQTVVSFDKIFLPASIGACVLSLAKEPSLFIYVYAGSLLLLTFWVFLSWRYRQRIADRFCIMKTIERRLGFEAHLLISDELRAPKDRTLRWGFYWVAVCSGAVVLLWQWLIC